AKPSAPAAPCSRNRSRPSAASTRCTRMPMPRMLPSLREPITRWLVHAKVGARGRRSDSIPLARMSSTLEAPPRILDVDLGAPGASASYRSVATPELERLASWGGSATCAALFLEAARRGELDAARIVIAVGAAVRAGLPTA